MDQAMNQIQVSELATAVLGQMKALQYSKSTVDYHARVYGRLQAFSVAIYSGSYSAEVKNAFLKETERQFSKNRNPRFVEKYCTAINKIDDVFVGKPIQSMHRVAVPLINSILDGCLDGFREHLKQRLVPKGIENQMRMVAKFLSMAEKSGVCSLPEICPQNIYDGFEAATDKNTYSRSIKNFLRYAFKEGLMPIEYSLLVPSKRNHKTVPSVYSKEQIEKTLMLIDRKSASGKRTYAVLLLCARLGMRISDVCNLEFSDINKISKTIEFIQVKTKVPLTLPLLSDVAAALDDYISDARPVSDSPKIFLRVQAPFLNMTPATMSYEIKRYFDLAGIDTSRKKHGPHSLRASLASALLDEQVSYPVIQKVLGHSHPSATKHYTKIDVRQLRDCALEVPPPSGKFASYLVRGY
jgi:site-specific recombinase XerD